MLSAQRRTHWEKQYEKLTRHLRLVGKRKFGEVNVPENRSRSGRAREGGGLRGAGI